MKKGLKIEEKTAKSILSKVILSGILWIDIIILSRKYKIL